MSRRGTAALLLAGLAASSAIACGSGSGSGPSPSPTARPISPERARFIAAADAKCGAASDQLRALPPATTLQDYGASLAQAVPLLKQLESQLRALPVPPGDGPVLAKLFSDFDRFADQTVAFVEAASRGDRAAADAQADRLGPLNTSIQNEAKAYGFRVCGQPSGPAPGGSPGGSTATSPPPA